MQMAKVSTLLINQMELRYPALMKMESTLVHLLLKIRDPSIKSAKTMKMMNLKIMKMKIQKWQPGCIIQSKKFIESMLIHLLMMSLMKACKYLGKEAFITKEFRECKIGQELIREVILSSSTSITTGVSKWLFQVVVDLEDHRFNRVSGRLSR